MPIQSVYFLGLGALGAKYAASFYDYNSSLVKIIVNEERKTRYEKENIFVNQKEYQFDYITSVDNNQYPDFIFVVVKSEQLDQAIIDLKPFVGENTLILSLMNGISSERKLAEVFGWDKVVNAVAYMDAVKVGNQVSYGSIGMIIFGHVKNQLQDRLQELNELMTEAKIPNKFSDDIENAQWAKYLVNVVTNQLSFLLEFTYGQIMTNEYADNLMNMISDEVLTIGEAHGITIGQKDVERMKATLGKVEPTSKTSMYQDRDAKRISEVEEFAGEIIRLGKQYTIATPYNEFIYNMVKAIEKDY